MLGMGNWAVGTREEWKTERRSLRTAAVGKKFCAAPQTCLLRGREAGRLFDTVVP